MQQQEGFKATYCTHVCLHVHVHIDMYINMYTHSTTIHEKVMSAPEK